MFLSPAGDDSFGEDVALTEDDLTDTAADCTATVGAASRLVQAPRSVQTPAAPEQAVKLDHNDEFPYKKENIPPGVSVYFVKVSASPKIQSAINTDPLQSTI